MNIKRFALFGFCTTILFLHIAATHAGGEPQNLQYEFKWLSDSEIILFSNEIDPPYILELPKWKLKKLDFSTKYKLVALSSNGKLITVYDDLKAFQYGAPTGSLSQPINIPLWLSLPKNADHDKYFYNNIENRLFWLNDEDLIINQRDRETGEVVCKKFNTILNQWQGELEHCIDFPSANINDIQYNPVSKLLVINGAAESAQEINIKKWTGINATEDTMFPMLNLTHGVINIGFNADQKSIWLTSPCILSNKKSATPCNGIDLDKDQWHHFQWSTGNKSLSTIRSNIPTNSIPGISQRNVYVWLKNDSICVGDPGKDGKFRCKIFP